MKILGTSYGKKCFDCHDALVSIVYCPCSFYLALESSAFFVDRTH
jgi:hypothetical protein